MLAHPRAKTTVEREEIKENQPNPMKF